MYDDDSPADANDPADDDNDDGIHPADDADGNVDDLHPADDGDDDDADRADEETAIAGVDGAIPGVGGGPTGIPGVGDDPVELLSQMDALYGAQEHEYNLRPRKPRDHSHLHADLEHTAFTQYNVRRSTMIPQLV